MDSVPKTMIRVFPNQKRWMNRQLVEAKSATFKPNDPEWRKKSIYDLWRVIKDARRESRIERES